MIRRAVALLCLSGCAHAAQLGVALPVPDAVVWVEGAARPAISVAEITQHDQEFDPFVTVVSTGSRVTFPNRDKVKHHVYSFSAPKTFEIQLYSGTPTEPVTFDKAGVVVMGCNIHDWMLAYVVVVDSPFFAKSDKGGRAVIDNLPAGRYTVHAWHPYQDVPLPVQVVELGAADKRDLKLDLKVTMPARKPRPAGGDSY